MTKVQKARRIATLTLRTGEETRVTVNEDTEPTSFMYDTPYVYDSEGYPHEELSRSMTQEMSSMRKFDVFTEVPISSLPSETLRTAITTRWVHRWKGDSVRSRLVCRGFTEEVKDEGQTYASTPLLVMVKLLVLLSLSLNWHIEFWDVGIAFLHASVSAELYVAPPKEFYDQGTVLWRP